MLLYAPPSIEQLTLTARESIDREKDKQRVRQTELFIGHSTAQSHNL